MPTRKVVQSKKALAPAQERPNKPKSKKVMAPRDRGQDSTRILGLNWPTVPEVKRTKKTEDNDSGIMGLDWPEFPSIQKNEDK